MKGMYTGWTEGVPEKKSSDKIEKKLEIRVDALSLGPATLECPTF